MESDLMQRLQNIPRAQLIHLLEVLIQQHPDLHVEIERILTTTFSATAQPATETEGEFTADTLVLRRPLPQPGMPSQDLDLYQQRLLVYPARLQQGASPQDIFDDLITILQDAEIRADQYDYQQALNIYALVIDNRLTLQQGILTHIFDRSIDEFMPVLAMLLSEVSSVITTEDSPDIQDTHEADTIDLPTIAREIRGEPSPLLSSHKRQGWLTRLFALWIKRIDNHHADEDVPEIILEVAWSEDVPLLQALIEKELYQRPTSIHSNIVDFSLQSRTRMLEKFLRELPKS